MILYHADLSIFSGWFPGGFLGVDIFFVISGYLITGLILRESRQGRFSYANFYLRRARRLLPALFTVATVSLVVGWWLMLPSQFREMAESIRAALLFLSNMFFLFENSYTAEVAPLKPFLHTWSLSVEEQFYLLYPVALITLFHQVRRHVFTALVITAAMSLGLSTYLALVTSDYAFYLFPTRIWELVAGALIAVRELQAKAPGRQFADAWASIGLVLIAISITLIDDRFADPSLHTVVPVMGTVLVIQYAPASRVGNLLGVRWLVTCGLMSYSLYLWHHPALAFARIAWVGQVTDLVLAMAILISVIAAWVSWRFIETPLRNQQQVHDATFLKGLVGSLTALLLLPGFSANGTIPAIMSKTPETGVVDLEGFEPGDEADMILVGDSHAAPFGRSLREQLQNRGLHLCAMLHDGCPYIYSAIRANRQCAEHNASVRQRILDSNVTDIFIVSRFTSAFERSTYTNANGVTEVPIVPHPGWLVRATGQPIEDPNILGELLLRDLSELMERGKRIYLIEPVPELGIHPVLHWKQNRNVPTVKEPVDRYLRRNQVILDALGQAKQNGMHVIETRTIFCDDSFCHARLGDWLYRDDNHLSHYAAAQIVERLMLQIDQNRALLIDAQETTP
ncbi:MAG: acyltransferase [Pseudomonadales bacterium]|nr:acyltransferase [Pseudomonadales bacterium]